MGVQTEESAGRVVPSLPAPLDEPDFIARVLEIKAKIDRGRSGAPGLAIT